MTRAADDLASRFAESREGPFGARLLRITHRFFDFVDAHGPGFSALMRGGPAVGSSRTNALIDGVRQAAYVQILSHLDVDDAPPARLELVVRSWISSPSPRPSSGWTAAASRGASWRSSSSTTSRPWRR